MTVCVFDAVGTLITPRRPVAEVYEELGRLAGFQLTAGEIEPRFRQAFRRAFGRSDQRTSDAREQVRWRRLVEEVFGKGSAARRLFRDLWHLYAQPTSWEVYPDVTSCLQRLTNRGVALALASNFDLRLFAIHRELPELQAIELLFVSSEIGWRKPHPRFFQAIVGRLPERGARWMVGDRLEDDVAPALAAGCNAVWLRRDRTGPVPAGVVAIPSLDQLPALVCGPANDTTPG